MPSKLCTETLPDLLAGQAVCYQLIQAQ